ncbi:MAG: hypothetical protein IT304_06820 [Dehalococcoidia bacterium]|nr:hypothetical protein [Dehalococcoidia bacterium]
MRDARLVVVASVSSAGNGAAVLQPEAYLKGTASGGQLRLAEYTAPGCDFPSLAPGQRILALLSESDGRLGWPTFSQLYVLADGRSVGGREQADAGTEAALVARVRALTDQYAVPAATKDEGVGVDWRATVVPVGLALAVVFAIGLVLMRVWHRIDPS